MISLLRASWVHADGKGSGPSQRGLKGSSEVLAGKGLGVRLRACTLSGRGGGVFDIGARQRSGFIKRRAGVLSMVQREEEEQDAEAEDLPHNSKTPILYRDSPQVC